MKLIIILLAALLMFGCQTVHFKESKEVQHDQTEFSFRLPPDVPFYKVSMTFKYKAYKVKGLEEISYQLLAPSGKTYENSFPISRAGGKNKGGSTHIFKSIKNVSQEEGIFKLIIEKKTNRETLESVTVRVRG